MANLHQPWMQRTGAGSPSRLPPLGDAGDGSGRLEGLLSAVDNMDNWDGDGVFSDEKKGKKKKGKKKRGGDDPSADQPAAFGGTSGAATSKPVASKARGRCCHTVGPAAGRFWWTHAPGRQSILVGSVER